MDNDYLCGISTVATSIVNDSQIYETLTGISDIDQTIEDGSPVDQVVDGPSVLFLSCVE